MTTEEQALVDALNAAVATLTSEKEQLQLEISEKDSIIDALKNREADLKHDKQNLEEHVSHLEQDINALQQQVDQYRNNYENLLESLGSAETLMDHISNLPLNEKKILAQKARTTEKGRSAFVAIAFGSNLKPTNSTNHAAA